ncbi:uncharacterized protein SOCEGT47_029580 [Sorangium cellulosum]|uniref:Uncharacterized protein n=1 Tax=Sorangium cellulosum TaxID=56 RepID=A0A4P2PZW2_SORCE|nr:Lar family restriction alleviation protein [Sorangium cellulosum]AUX22455.1 uncharacterized protein SOCEGT47_029580 [Sorangium cellulosum]
MISVAVKVETECGTCRLPMPVNTLAREVSCASCGRPTEIGGDLWQALLRDPLYNGPRLLANEARRSSAGKLTAAYLRRGPSCQGCQKEIPLAAIQEVREQAMLRCDRCARQTWVRAVPAPLAGALANITHLVGEDPDPLAGAPAPETEAATFPCPHCGSPAVFDGVNRASTCRFCGASVHVPDDFVYRGRRRVAAHWYLCFHPSITLDAPASQAVAAGLFDWEGLPVAAVDAEGNLYCAATQVHWCYDESGDVRERRDHVLWSVDPSLNIRWIHRDRPEAVRLLFCLKDALVVVGEGSSLRWLSSSTGTPIDGPRGAAPRINVELPAYAPLTCYPDGSLLFHRDDRLRRIAPNGEEIPVWGGSGDPGNEADDDPISDWEDVPDCPVRLPGFVDGLYRGYDDSLYVVSPLSVCTFARFDAHGRKICSVKLPERPPMEEPHILGADLHGNAYVLLYGLVARIGAAGDLSIVLQAERDALPGSKMRIAVCPDGSFWLFGEEGLAWKFESGGRLLFASEKEPRPKKVTKDELYERQKAEQAEAFLAHAERLRVRRIEEARGEIEWKERQNIKIGCMLAILLAVPLLVFFAWAIWGRSQP